jgi:hypothetical protein
MAEDKPKQINLKMTEEVVKGHYANFALISHTQEEFTLDFFNVNPAQGQGVATSRVIMSPGHFKRFIKALADNLKKHEERFGQIKAAEAPTKEPKIGFGTQ